MKAPWFPFYTGDFLASPDVQLMEAHEVGAYLLLLANSWQSDTPGYLPNQESRLRRVCRLSADQWKESRDLLLSKWPLAGNGMLCNPRLLKEADTQLARRDRLAANGAKGGRPAQNQKDTKPEPTDNLQLSENNLQVIETEPTGLLSQPQPQATNVAVNATAAEPLQAKSLKQLAAGQAAADGVETYTADTVPMLNEPRLFAIVVERLGYDVRALDVELYRKQIRSTAESAGMDAGVLQFQNFIKKYLNNEQRSPAGLVPPAGRVLLPNQVASNAARPVVSSGIPNKEDYLKPKVAGQYTGSIN